MGMLRLSAAVFGLVLAATAARADPQVAVEYGDPGSDPAVVHAHDVLVNSKALEELQQFLTPLRLPANLNLRAEACGATRKAYDPQSKTATICYETIAKILEVVAAQTDASDADKKGAVIGAIVETMLHETAYALFDIYHVPIWGRIEDAADRFSAFVMTQFGEDVAQTTILGTSRFFLWSKRTWTGSSYASSESPEAQRFYNFLCVAYGADPITFDSLATGGALPEHRLVRCPGEFQQIRKAFDLRIMPYVDPDALVKARAQSW